MPEPRPPLSVATVGAATLVAGVLALVSTRLPLVPPWAWPVALLAATVVLLIVGRRRASCGLAESARAWAGWAGLASAVAVVAVGTLTGFSGALLPVLTAALAVNAGIALWFRSPIHLVVLQAAALVAGLLAHIDQQLPLLPLAAALPGLWWTRAVGHSRAVTAATTVLLPVSATLLVHPLTHVSLAIDGADVVTLAGFTALASLIGARVGRHEAPARLWPTMHATIVAVLSGQLVAAGVPAVGRLLSPSGPAPQALEIGGVAPGLLLPGVLLGWTALAAAASLALLAPLRRGAASCLALCAALAVAPVVSLVSPLAAALLASGVLGALLVSSRAHGRGRALRSLALVALAAVTLAEVGASTDVVGGVLLTVGVLVLVVGAGGRTAAAPGSRVVRS